MFLFVQYAASSSVPIEGFYIYYRETSNAGDYIKATVEGEAQRSFVITHLQPDTSYDIKLQSFTVGAASDFSIILTNKTLRKCNNTTVGIGGLGVTIQLRSMDFFRM